VEWTKTWSQMKAICMCTLHNSHVKMSSSPCELWSVHIHIAITHRRIKIVRVPILPLLDCSGGLDSAQRAQRFYGNAPRRTGWTLIRALGYSPRHRHGILLRQGPVENSWQADLSSLLAVLCVLKTRSLSHSPFNKSMPNIHKALADK
jgi:hypothetical protein